MVTNLAEPENRQAETFEEVVNLEELTEGICHDMQGQVDPAIVRQVLVSLLPKYQGARILTFVPVLMQRDALDILRSTL